jgi:predicted acetyltransferase
MGCMSSQIIQLGAGDFDEAIRFLNAVFGEYRPHDFASMLPTRYQPTDEHMSCNYAVRDGGRLAAVVGVFPIHWCVGDVTLKVAGVGGVAVHPGSRGQGYMKLLMDHAIAEMRRTGCDLSYLGGRRQRYAYFGYEVAGTTYRLSFIKDNIRHAFAGQEQAVTFKPARDDPQTVAALKAMHDAQPLYCERPAELFYRCLQSWHRCPMLACNRDGQIVGYLTPLRDKPVLNELVARDAETAAQIVRAWVQQASAGVEVLLQAPPGAVLRRLNGFAEHMRIEAGGNWQIFNWVRVVDALLKARHTAGPLAHGSLVLGIEGAASAISLTVDSDGAHCRATDRDPDLSLDPLTATRLLFGPGPTSAVLPLPQSASILAAWCPLPLGFSHQDHV